MGHPGHILHDSQPRLFRQVPVYIMPKINKSVEIKLISGCLVLGEWGKAEGVRVNGHWFYFGGWMMEMS